MRSFYSCKGGRTHGFLYCNLIISLNKMQFRREVKDLTQITQLLATRLGLRMRPLRVLPHIRHNVTEYSRRIIWRICVNSFSLWQPQLWYWDQFSIVEKFCKEIPKQIPKEFHAGGSPLYFRNDIIKNLISSSSWILNLLLYLRFSSRR